MKKFQFKTLRTRLTVQLISPVLLILLLAGLSGFIYARGVLLEQWNESVMLKLEQAAHEIDMRLSNPLELLEMISKISPDASDDRLLENIVYELENLPGIVHAGVNWHSATRYRHVLNNKREATGRGRFMRFHRGAFTKIAPPKVDEALGEQTVSVTMVLLDASDTPLGNLEIVLKFDFLVADITTDVWWQNGTACIADRASGHIFLNSGLMQGRQALGEFGDALETELLGEIDRHSAGTIRGPGHPPKRVAGFHQLEIFPWVLVVFADGKTILAPIINFRNGTIIGAMVLILTIFAIIRFNVDRMSATIRHLAKAATTLAEGNYGEKINVVSRDEIGQLAATFNAMVDGLKERDTIRNTFGLYVNPDFARVLLKQPETSQLGGKRKEVAILMADIRGFTPMTENMSPEATVDMLNRYFSAIIPLIQMHRGIIVDFVGDGILAFFEPDDEPLAAMVKRGVRCALDMQNEMDILNRQVAESDLPSIKMGIGVNCGPVVVGNIGSETRKKYGIVGAAVNVTQRIQGQSDVGEVVISEAVYDKVKFDVTVDRQISATLRGVTSAVKLYAIKAHQALNRKT